MQPASNQASMSASESVEAPAQDSQETKKKIKKLSMKPKQQAKATEAIPESIPEQSNLEEEKDEAPIQKHTEDSSQLSDGTEEGVAGQSINNVQGAFKTAQMPQQKPMIAATAERTTEQQNQILKRMQSRSSDPRDESIANEEDLQAPSEDFDTAERKMGVQRSLGSLLRTKEEKHTVAQQQPIFAVSNEQNDFALNQDAVTNEYQHAQVSQDQQFGDLYQNDYDYQQQQQIPDFSNHQMQPINESHNNNFNMQQSEVNQVDVSNANPFSQMMQSSQSMSCLQPSTTQRAKNPFLSSNEPVQQQQDGYQQYHGETNNFFVMPDTQQNMPATTMNAQNNFFNFDFNNTDAQNDYQPEAQGIPAEQFFQQEQQQQQEQMQQQQQLNVQAQGEIDIWAHLDKFASTQNVVLQKPLEESDHLSQNKSQQALSACQENDEQQVDDQVDNNGQPFDYDDPFAEVLNVKQPEEHMGPYLAIEDQAQEVVQQTLRQEASQPKQQPKLPGLSEILSARVGSKASASSRSGGGDLHNYQIQVESPVIVEHAPIVLDQQVLDSSLPLKQGSFKKPEQSFIESNESPILDVNSEELNKQSQVVGLVPQQQETPIFDQSQFNFDFTEHQAQPDNNGSDNQDKDELQEENVEFEARESSNNCESGRDPDARAQNFNFDLNFQFVAPDLEEEDQKEAQPFSAGLTAQDEKLRVSEPQDKNNTSANKSRSAMDMWEQQSSSVENDENNNRQRLDTFAATSDEQQPDIMAGRKSDIFQQKQKLQLHDMVSTPETVNYFTQGALAKSSPEEEDAAGNPGVNALVFEPFKLNLDNQDNINLSLSSPGAYQHEPDGQDQIKSSKNDSALIQKVEQLEQEKQNLQAELAGAKQLQEVMVDKIRTQMATQMRSRLEAEITEELQSKFESQMQSQFQEQLRNAMQSSLEQQKKAFDEQLCEKDEQIGIITDKVKGLETHLKTLEGNHQTSQKFQAQKLKESLLNLNKEQEASQQAQAESAQLRQQMKDLKANQATQMKQMQAQMQKQMQEQMQKQFQDQFSKAVKQQVDKQIAVKAKEQASFQQTEQDLMQKMFQIEIKERDEKLKKQSAQIKELHAQLQKASGTSGGGSSFPEFKLDLSNQTPSNQFSTHNVTNQTNLDSLFSNLLDGSADKKDHAS